MKSNAKKTVSLFQAIELRRSGLVEVIPLLVLAAHEDDETIGASVILQHASDCKIVFLTDGAPRDRCFWPSLAALTSREKYAEVRRSEAIAALSVAGVSRKQVHWLGAVDQEAISEIVRLVEDFTVLIQRHRPKFIITHSYEGGHPDHDAAALVADLALKTSSRNGSPVPELIEMSSYHARDGRCVTGEFLPRDDAQELVSRLTPQELEMKQQMLARYESQREVLKYFSAGEERFRSAPNYDFSHPPHVGKLWYECMGWPMNGAHWRELAADALSHFETKSALENICG